MALNHFWGCFFKIIFFSVTVKIPLESIIPATNILNVYSTYKCSVSLVRQTPADLMTYRLCKQKAKS